MIGADVLDLALRRLGLRQIRFTHRPVGTALREGGKAKALAIRGKHQYQLFLKERQIFQVFGGGSALRQAYQRAIERGVQHLQGQLAAGLGFERQYHLRALGMKPGKQRRQAAGGGGVHRPHA